MISCRQSSVSQCPTSSPYGRCCCGLDKMQDALPTGDMEPEHQWVLMQKTSQDCEFVQIFNLHEDMKEK